MDTSAGVKASYPSQVQATVGWTLTTLKKLSPEKRKAFGVTLKDLTAAEKRAKAAGQLWGVVMKSGDSKADDVKKDATVKKALTASGLKDADLDQMLAFRDLRGVMDETADAELAKAEEANGEPLTRAERENVYRAVGKTVAADDANESIKMGHVSIRSHIRQDKEPKRSPKWREDMAGWQRKAVESGARGPRSRKLRPPSPGSSGATSSRGCGGPSGSGSGTGRRTVGRRCAAGGGCSRSSCATSAPSTGWQIRSCGSGRRGVGRGGRGRRGR